MKNFTLFLFVLLAGFGLSSCLMEEPEHLIFTPEVVEEPSVEEEPVAETFVVYDQAVDITHAYLYTVPTSEGRYLHQLILTDQEVYDGNDLTGMATGAAATFITASASPIGQFRSSTVPADEPQPGALVSAGSSVDVDFSQVSFSEFLPYVYYDNSLVITEEEAGNFRVNLKLNTDYSSFRTEGTYAGPITLVNPGGSEEYDTSNADFSGENLWNTRWESFPTTSAYLVNTGIQNERGRLLELFISDREVEKTGGALSGVANVMLLRLRFPGGELKSGKFRLGGNPEGTGYFGRQQGGRLNSGYVCRNMNFSTSTMDDDEPMDGGEALVYVDGGDISIRYTFTSVRGGTVTGLYKGSLETMNP